MNKQLIRTSQTTKVLNGKEYKFTYSSGMGGHIKFFEDKLSWEITAGKNLGSTGTNKYLAREIDPDIYMLQWYEADINATFTIVINEKVGSVSSSQALDDMRIFDTGILHEIIN